MKTCPDCAESVQEAARKCRYCGYLFASGDDEPAPEASSAEAPARPSLGFLLTAVGGAGILAATIAGILAVATGPENVGPSLKLVNLIGFVAGGIALAIGWGVISARDEASAGGVGGALVLVAGQLYATTLTEADQTLTRELVTTVAMVVFLFLHLGTLEKARFDGTRLGAIVALVGFGGLLIGFFNQWDLPSWLGTALAWCGLGGLVQFALGLTLASVLRLQDR